MDTELRAGGAPAGGVPAKRPPAAAPAATAAPSTSPAGAAAPAAPEADPTGGYLEIARRKAASETAIRNIDAALPKAKDARLRKALMDRREKAERDLILIQHEEGQFQVKAGEKLKEQGRQRQIGNELLQFRHMAPDWIDGDLSQDELMAAMGSISAGMTAETALRGLQAKRSRAERDQDQAAAAADRVERRKTSEARYQQRRADAAAALERSGGKTNSAEYEKLVNDAEDDAHEVGSVYRDILRAKMGRQEDPAVKAAKEDWDQAQAHVREIRTGRPAKPAGAAPAAAAPVAPADVKARLAAALKTAKITDPNSPEALEIAKRILAGGK